MATKFGPYSLLGLLGRGGMGEVWLALDTRTDREVALKILGAWLQDDDEFAARFRRESAQAARLNNPNIVPIHGFGEIDGRLYLDMAFIEGTDLATLITRGLLLPKRAVGIVAQVAKALDSAHQRGLMHRDVKPPNILVSDNGGEDHVYLIDFGIAITVNDTRMTRTGNIIGTPAYMAPERFAGEGDWRSDIYALGCVLHEALTGHRPFSATNPLMLLNAHQNIAPPRPSVIRTDLPPALDAVIACAMSKNPLHRFESGAALATAAKAALVLAPSAAPSPTKVTDTGAFTTITADRPENPAPRTIKTSPGQFVSRPTKKRLPDVESVARPKSPSHSRAATVLLALALLVGIVVAVILFIPTQLPPVLSTYRGAFSLATANIDGRPVVVSGGSDNTVRVWDLTTGKAVGSPLVGHTDYVSAVTTTQLSGRTVIISADGGRDGMVRVWDAATGKPVGAAFGDSNNGGIDGIAASQVDDRPVVITGDGGGSVKAWDLATGRQLRSVHYDNTRVDAVAVARLDNRQVVVSGSTDGVVRAWDLTSGKPVGRPITGPTGYISSIAITQLNGRPVVVAGTDDGTVWRWDLTTGDPIGTTLAAQASVSAVTVTQLDGRSVVVASTIAGSIQVWDLTTAAPVGPPLVDRDQSLLRAVVTASRDGRVVVISGGDSAMQTWDL